MASLAASSAAHSFHKILNQAKTHAKFRTRADVDDGVKKIRRLILVEGIPAALVRPPPPPLLLLAQCAQNLTCPPVHIRILRSVHEYGRFS